jgi:hypothetical protein
MSSERLNRSPGVEYKSDSKERVLVTSAGESELLWKHVLYGTETCIWMIEGYVDLKLPGNPVDRLTKMRDRINRLIERYEPKREP